MYVTNSRSPVPDIPIESIQEFYSAIIEYYDELFPLEEKTIQFLSDIWEEQKNSMEIDFAPMCRYLGIGCATGNLENRLVSEGWDVTGIDKNKTMIDTAKRRMKRGFSCIRFYEMSTIDMRHFLKKESFNIISCVDDMLPYIADEILLRKFFHDTYELLTQNGKLVIQCLNTEQYEPGKPIVQPERSSVRVTLSRTWISAEEGRYVLDATLEHGNGKRFVLRKNTYLLPATPSRIKVMAQEAGFTGFETYADYDKADFTGESENFVMVITK